MVRTENTRLANRPSACLVANLSVLACWAGIGVYGAWRMDPEQHKFTWKPPLEENVLECLGPENCGGLNCEKDWDKCYLNEKKGCYKWWPDLTDDEKQQVKALCAKTAVPVDERVGLDAPVERKGKFNENGMLEITKTDCKRKGCKCKPKPCKCDGFEDETCDKPRVGTKFRYAVDVEIKRTFFHGSPGVYDTINDLALRQRVERLVAEKCRYGGAYYKLTHYGTYVGSDDDTSCDEIRDPPNNDKSRIAKWTRDSLRWLRQEGLDGWFWKMLGKPPHGFLTTPLLLPWEVGQCATVPCPGQCIAVSADAALEDCPASSAFWPVRMLGRIVTEILIPLLAVRLALYLSGSIVSRLRCCPRACKDRMKQVDAVRRSCWFWVKRAGRKVGRRWLCLNWHIQRAVFFNTISLLRASPVVS